MGETRRGYVYAKGKRLYLAWYDAAGKRRLSATGLPVGEEAEAERTLRALQARTAAERAAGGTGPATVASWGATWVERRKAKGIASAGDDEKLLRLYIRPALGSVPLRDLDDRQIARFVAELGKRKSRMGGTLSARTILAVYGALRQLCKAAVKERLIPVSPCTLDAEDLPAKRDKDPEWRDRARFTAAELELLISHPDIREDWRLGWALMGLAGMRWGEVAALRWRHYDKERQPLGCLTVALASSDRRKALGGAAIGQTKTGAVRLAPVHPTLARMLAAWRLRHPAGPDDLILPATQRETRRTTHAYQRLREHLDLLGLRPRRLHDLRSTMISIAQDDGAPREVVRQITHQRDQRDIMEGYTKRQWETLCRAVSGMRVELREPEVIELRQAAGAATALLPPEPENQKAPESLRKSGAVLVGDAGFEPARGPHATGGISGEEPGKSRENCVRPKLTACTDPADSGASGSSAATDPEQTIRRALATLPPSDARALLLRLALEIP